MAEEKVVPPYDIRSGEMSPTKLRDALEVQGAKTEIFAPQNSQEFVDIRGNSSRIAVYPECGLICVSDNSHYNLTSHSTSFIENEDAVRFISEVRKAAWNRSSKQPSRRMLRHVLAPASGVPASIAGWSVDVLAYGGALPPSLFALTAITSVLGAVVKGGANNIQDYKRGAALQSMLKSGWQDREIFYPKTESNPEGLSVIEFRGEDTFVVDRTVVGDDVEPWEYGTTTNLFERDVNGQYNIRLSRLFSSILADYPDDRAELWKGRLKDDIEFYKTQLKEIQNLKKEEQLFKRTEQFTQVVDITKRAEIDQAKADVQAGLVARTSDLLSDLRERRLAGESRKRAIEMEKANKDRISKYNAVGKWAHIEMYPEETRRDIQILLNGAAALKDDFIQKYGVDKGLDAVDTFDGYTRQAVQFMSEGASFNHIYQGLVKWFGEVENGAQEPASTYSIVLPPLEDFQRLYAPEQEQGPVGVFGERYPNAFYNIAISTPTQPEADGTSLDLR